MAEVPGFRVGTRVRVRPGGDIDERRAVVDLVRVPRYVWDKVGRVEAVIGEGARHCAVVFEGADLWAEGSHQVTVVLHADFLEELGEP